MRHAGVARITIELQERPMSVATLPKQAVDQITALSKKAEDLTIETIERFAETAAKVAAKLPTPKLPFDLPFSIPSPVKLIELSYDAAEDVLAASKTRSLRVFGALSTEVPVAKPVASKPAAPKATAPKATAPKVAPKAAARKPAARKPAARKAPASA
jgi:hypothetical protein